MKKTIISAAVFTAIIVIMAGYGTADTVYLKDGRSVAGTVTKENGKVIVTNGDSRQEFDESEVLYTQSTSTPVDIPMPTIDIGTTSAPSSSPSQSSTDAPVPTSVPTSTPTTYANIPPPMSESDVAHYSMPDSIAYLLMRRMTAGAATRQEIQMLRTWQAAAHDKRRKIDSRWQNPKDFVARRESFDKLIKSSQEQFKNIKEAGSDATDAAKIEADNKKYLSAGMAYLRQAATSQLDPVVRNFLLGDYALQQKDYPSAETAFKECCKDAPLVAAFWQGHGKALLGLNRQLDSLSSFLTAVKLNPESEIALAELKDAMEAVPGAQIKHKTFTYAQEFLDTYRSVGKNKKKESERTTYLMPGKNISVDDRELPKVPFDHLNVVQAVATVVGKNTLLIDSQAIDGALEIFIQIDDKTLEAASFTRSSGGAISRAGSEGKPLVPIKMHSVNFTPPEIPKALLSSSGATSKKSDDSSLVSVGHEITIYTADIYSEMGGKTLRTIKTKVAKINDDGSIVPESGILAGETTGPIITAEGSLVGFLTGPLDVTSDTGGESRYVPLKDVSTMLRSAAAKGSSSHGDSSSSSGVKKKTDAVKDVKGVTFMAIIIKGEHFQ